ncbi:MAG TPA: glycosyltransferase [Chloroflexi bacterium]|nr:glycosyltransferase [Chloroflexota bacterium]
MRVLMLTRRVDKDDWLAGFAHTWIERLACHERVERLDVICLEMGRHDLPSSVHVASMGKERGYGRLRELWEFQKAIAPVIRQADVLFGHMIPRYTLAAAPWALTHRVPVVQWYTHRQVTLELRLVHALAARVVTASPESFRLRSEKLTVLGHGIDTERFRPPAHPSEERLVLAVGRLSPIKHYETLIEATARLVARPGYQDVRIAIAGGTTPQHGEAYGEHLRALARERGVSDHVVFLGPVPHREMHTLYRQAAVSVNLCPTGGADKAVLESMACGLPVVVRNRTFLPLLGDEAERLWLPELDPDLLADRLADLLLWPVERRQALGGRLRERVRADYDLDGLIGRLVTVFEEVIAGR